jgi:hypothetical protein
VALVVAAVALVVVVATEVDPLASSADMVAMVPVVVEVEDMVEVVVVTQGEMDGFQTQTAIDALLSSPNSISLYTPTYTTHGISTPGLLKCVPTLGYTTSGSFWILRTNPHHTYNRNSSSNSSGYTPP